MDLYDIAIARKLSDGGGGGGGEVTVESLSITENGTYTAPTGKAYSPVTVNVSGGGGSSDLTTAQVTIIDPHEKFSSLYGAFVHYEGGDAWSTYTGSSGGINTVILYRGYAYVQLVANNSPQYSTSENIIDDGEGYFYITGDGTITIS